MPLFDPQTVLGKEKVSFSGTDVSVVFSIHGSMPSYIADKRYFRSAQLQTISLTSAASLFPVRRCGEASATTLTKGARTVAGSMVFTILGQDPLQEIFSIDAIKSAARTDSLWHIDQMPPIDCLLIFATETGGRGLQVIQNMQISNWGEVVSIDDMYIESSYTFIAEHITPFLSMDLMSASGTSSNRVAKVLEDRMSDIRSNALTPDDAAITAIGISQKEIIDKYGWHAPTIMAQLAKDELKLRAGKALNLMDIGVSRLIDNIETGTTKAGEVYAIWTTAPEIPSTIFDLTNLKYVTR